MFIILKVKCTGIIQARVLLLFSYGHYTMLLPVSRYSLAWVRPGAPHFGLSLTQGFVYTHWKSLSDRVSFQTSQFQANFSRYCSSKAAVFRQHLTLDTFCLFC